MLFDKKSTLDQHFKAISFTLFINISYLTVFSTSDIAEKVTYTSENRLTASNSRQLNLMDFFLNVGYN